ncbi:unnamed protein product [Effrenium voratum]|nr:unnamed protein product [Effrenium voratum]
MAHEARGRGPQGESCRVDPSAGPRGKPALSFVSPLAHSRRLPQDDFTLLAISIWTGRQHQIRVHLQHVGHATVYDGRQLGQTWSER